MRPPRKWKGRTSGANVGRKAVRLWVCADRACSVWHDAVNGQPAQCKMCGGLQFIHMPSKAEATRYAELLLLVSRGKIDVLELQTKWPLIVITPGGGREKIGEYRSDFNYLRDGFVIVEDVKGGADTDMSHWKRKHVEAQYGIKIDIVTR